MPDFDPQFGSCSIMRPYAGFEAIYDSKSASLPIMFSKNGVALDPLATQNASGIDPELISGLSVTPGSRMILYLPNIMATTVVEPVAFAPYSWEISWRWRNISDYMRTRSAWHMANANLGLPSISSPRIIIPAANHSIVYNQAEPVTVAGRVAQNLRIEDITALGQSQTLLPLNPDGLSGKYQQGIFNPTISNEPLSSSPTYNAYDVMALGDEMMIGCYRSTSVVANWQFTSGLLKSDLLLSKLFGNGDVAGGGPFLGLGLYVNMGIAP